MSADTLKNSDPASDTVNSASPATATEFATTSLRYGSTPANAAMAREDAASRQCAPVPVLGIVRCMAFRGWPAEAGSFYEGLEADNSKTYWAAHKDVYESAVVAPFRALSDEIADDFGPLHLFRPHRDVRFSKDKSPYKTAQGAVTESEGGAIYYVSLG